MDKGDFIQVEVKDTTNNVERRFGVENSEGCNFADVIRKYSELRPPHRLDQRFLFAYEKGRGRNLPVGIYKVRSIPSDAAKYLNFPSPKQYTGHALRRTGSSGLN